MKAFMLSAAALLVGCATVAPREQARAVVLGVAEATRVADKACATAALETASADLAGKCATSYSIARPAIVAAATSVDAWNEGAQGSVMCAVETAGNALLAIATAIEKAGERVPPIVIDGIKLASMLGGCK